jgi:hypothetical protein
MQTADWLIERGGGKGSRVLHGRWRRNVRGEVKILLSHATCCDHVLLSPFERLRKPSL